MEFYLGNEFVTELCPADLGDKSHFFCFRDKEQNLRTFFFFVDKRLNKMLAHISQYKVLHA